jgi:peptide subunit release factor 1 (eRF1)
MAENLIAFELTEVDRISFECPDCHCEITYRLKESNALPRSCCAQGENEMRNVFGAYQQFFEVARDVKGTVRVIGRVCVPTSTSEIRKSEILPEPA